MERRKVQLAGNSTYTISLPKAWAEEQGIETGMELRLRPREGRLVLETDRGTDEPVPVVDLTDVPPAEAGEVVGGMYALGCDEFDLRHEGGFPADVRRSVSETAAGLAGLEVGADDGTTVRCRDLLDASELSVPRVVSRLEFAALSAHRRATDALVEGTDGSGGGAAAAIADHRRNAAAEAALLERRFQRTLTDVVDLDRLGVSRTALFDHLRVGEELERVASFAAAVARAAGGEPPADAPAEAFADCARQTRLSIEAATDAALAEAGLEDAFDAREEARRCAETARELGDDGASTTAPGSEPGSWFLAVGALERTADCAAAIAARAVQSALRRETREKRS